MAIVNGPELLAFLRSQGEEWIRLQQAILRPAGRRLNPVEVGTFAPFFDAPLLESARIAQVPTIENPDFYSILAQQNITLPLDFTQMAGITFDDTIALSHAQSPSPDEFLPLLFHELVHVVQYRTLGVEEFVRRYVVGWAENGFSYESIPLERWAYELDARFRRGGTPFSVGAEVSRQLA